MLRRPLALAAACAALGALVYLLAVHVPALQRADLDLLNAFIARGTPRRLSYASDLAAVFNPSSFALICLVALAGAMLVGRRRQAVAAAVLLVGANVTTQLLKQALAVQRPWPDEHTIGAAAYPSGHTTAVVSLALALAIIAPPASRRLVAGVGAVVALLTMASLLLMGWHYPSDLVGGVLVCATWAALVAAGARLSGSVRAPTSARRRLQRR